MKNLKKFESFNPYDDEPLTRGEEMFGKQTRLEKQFSKIVVKGLVDDDNGYWSTFNALKIELKDECDEVTFKELQTRVVEDENLGSLIQTNMEIGHSGTSYGNTMRHIEIISKYGLDEYREKYM